MNDSFSSLRILADEHYRQGRNEARLRTLRMLVRRFPDDLQSRAQLVDALFRRGAYASAERLVAGGLAAAPRDSALLELSGLLHAQRGRLTQSARAYEKACALAGGSLAPYFGFARTLTSMGQSRRMVAIMRRALRSAGRPPPGDVRAAVERFRLAFVACEFGAAADWGEKILSMTRDIEPLESLRWPVFVDEFDFAYGDAEFHSLALSALAREIRSRPRSPWGHYYRAIFHHSLADAAEPDPRKSAAWAKLRREDLSRVEATARSRHAWMRMERARQLLRSGDLRGAIPVFDAAAMSTTPHNWYSLCQIAEIYVCLGSRAQARLWFKKARKAARERDLGCVLAWEGEMSLWTGDYARALRLENEALARGAQYAHGWRGAALLKLGRPCEALRSLDRAVAVSPHDLESMIWRAEALRALGRRALALSQAEKAVRAGGNFYASILLAVLRLESGSARGVKREWARIPEPVRAAVERSCGRAGIRAKILWILTKSRGVRRAGWELRAWLGPRLGA